MCGVRLRAFLDESDIHALKTYFISTFDVITSFFSGYMFGGGTTAHRHTRTVPYDVTAGV